MRVELLTLKEGTDKQNAQTIRRYSSRMITKYVTAGFQMMPVCQFCKERWSCGGWHGRKDT